MNGPLKEEQEKLSNSKVEGERELDIFNSKMKEGDASEGLRQSDEASCELERMRNKKPKGLRDKPRRRMK